MVERKTLNLVVVGSSPAVGVLHFGRWLLDQKRVSSSERKSSCTIRDLNPGPFELQSNALTAELLEVLFAMLQRILKLFN